MKSQNWKTSIRAGNELVLCLTLDAMGLIQDGSLTGIGDLAFLEHLPGLRDLLRGPLCDVVLPKGNSCVEMMFRELVMRAQEKWQPPYADLELCHCRAVPREVVDQAILMGAHRPQLVSRWTSASTACGTCRPNVENIIKYRLTLK